MLSFVSYCALFSCGIIAACVDWNKFINLFLIFEKEITITKKVLNPTTGLPTGKYEHIKLEPDFEPMVLLPILLALLAVYYLFIFSPAKMIFDYLEEKYTPMVARFGLSKITYRKEMKRRGSWPLAYSTEFAQFREV